MTSGERIERMEEIANWISAIAEEWIVEGDEVAVPAALMAQTEDLGREFRYISGRLKDWFGDSESGENEP